MSRDQWQKWGSVNDRSSGSFFMRKRECSFCHWSLLILTFWYFKFAILVLQMMKMLIWARTNDKSWIQRHQKANRLDAPPSHPRSPRCTGLMVDGKPDDRRQAFWFCRKWDRGDDCVFGGLASSRKVWMWRYSGFPSDGCICGGALARARVSRSLN